MEGDSCDTIQCYVWYISIKSQWRHTLNHWQFDCLFNGLSRLKTKKKTHQGIVLLAIGEGNPPVIGGFPSQRVSNAESVSMP